jgi:hypothetical protein
MELVMGYVGEQLLARLIEWEKLVRSHCCCALHLTDEQLRVSHYFQAMAAKTYCRTEKGQERCKFTLIVGSFDLRPCVLTHPENFDGLQTCMDVLHYRDCDT